MLQLGGAPLGNSATKKCIEPDDFVDECGDRRFLGESLDATFQSGLVLLCRSTADGIDQEVLGECAQEAAISSQERSQVGDPLHCSPVGKFTARIDWCVRE